MLRPRGPALEKQIPPPTDRDCLAKTRIGVDGRREAGVTVLEHGLATASVAEALMLLYPPFLHALFFPSGTILTAAIHDVGKLTPLFQEKLRASIEDRSPSPFLQKLPHAAVSRITLQAVTENSYLADIVGKHHGNLDAGILAAAYSDIFGGPPWQELREQTLHELAALLHCDWPQIRCEEQAAVVAGLVSVSDWISSGPMFDQSIPRDALEDTAAQAVRAAGFASPAVVPGLSFEDIFGYTPYDLQRKPAELCRTPGICLIEAPMGTGKTEAALYVAYQLLASGAAHGMYFALPTQLTSNAIHARIDPFLRRITAEDSPHRQSFLLHGRAFLQESTLGGEGEPGKSWFSSLKRAVLAPFGVGTLDQALLGVLPDVRHSFVRAFGLLGKVVILDEIHSYDAYTSTLIHKLLALLRALRCPVVILSATLTAAKRAELLGQPAVSDGYPLISFAPYARQEQTAASEGFSPVLLPVEAHVCPVAGGRVVRMTYTEQRDSALRETLRRAKRGEQILWIENTVGEAQEVYKRLRAGAGELPCGLLHSRFMYKDRKRLEDEWTALYGKGAEGRLATGRILVGTQVLEQSLDIDADYLISALCPMDMLLQRLGRLWRHTLQRAQGAVCEALVLLPAPHERISEATFGPSGMVYAPYVLARTIEVLQGVGEIALPGDIRGLLEAVYAEREEYRDDLAALLNDWRKKGERLSRLAGLAAAHLRQSMPDSDDRLRTRYGEQEDVRVLLVRSVEKTGKGLHITAADGLSIDLPVDAGRIDGRTRRKFAAGLAQYTLTVNEYMAPLGKMPDYVYHCLRNYVFFGKNPKEPLCRVGLLEASGLIRCIDGSMGKEYILSYASHLGYSAEKRR
ncbi:MAG: CRISPR-associated helicase Cas3' [Desulfovibrio sp.]|jgi:CRISPR-associated endonuclease/helicase Cas3|nr:CRISPR-associated helicase Cas3' [Desulfovibrio sp.]